MERLGKTYGPVTCECPLQIPGAAMDRVSLLWRLRRRARRGVLCMAFFCISMALLYAICAENSVPVTDAIFGVRARTRAQPRAHSVAKVCRRLFHFLYFLWRRMQSRR
ncbi:hypothetical protein EYF80_044716 [Liparis tanakae]|uniref:Uncharacterized protein n=1 Tax=Liparis tanakae TaxID=230148 RepID=A0A4Z2FVR7_9TELE|nr:hypothetical protein EYF80_044716 [Liparis tanakae]